MGLNIGLNNLSRSLKTITVNDLFNIEIGYRLSLEGLNQVFDFCDEICRAYDNVIDLHKVANRYNSLEANKIIRSLAGEEVLSYSVEGFFADAWDKIKRFFSWLWDKLKSFFSWVWEKIKALFGSGSDSKIPNTPATNNAAADNPELNRNLKHPLPQDLINEAKDQGVPVQTIINKYDEDEADRRDAAIEKSRANYAKWLAEAKKIKSETKPNSALNNLTLPQAETLAKSLSNDTKSVKVQFVPSKTVADIADKAVACFNMLAKVLDKYDDETESSSKDGETLIQECKNDIQAVYTQVTDTSFVENNSKDKFIEQTVTAKQIDEELKDYPRVKGKLSYITDKTLDFSDKVNRGMRSAEKAIKKHEEKVKQLDDDTLVWEKLVLGLYRELAPIAKKQAQANTAAFKYVMDSFTNLSKALKELVGEKEESN